jgi:TetR/AcrR family transcriptional regulator, transcriptional repressor for nem operon
MLTKAMRVFWCKGYEATSIQDLVDGMGINRQSIYDTYGDKHTLFLATLRHYAQSAAREAVLPLIQIETWPGSIKDAIGKTLQCVVNEELGDSDKKGCMIANAALECAARDAEVATVVSAAAAATEALFHNALMLGKSRGEFPARFDARAHARVLANTVNGLRVMAKTSRSRPALQDVVNVTLTLLDA